MFARLLLRRGSTTEWANANPILELGEPGVDTTVNKIKIGDGITNWNNLDWANRLSTDELGDIVIDNPQNMQILTYQNNKWVNTNNKSCVSPSSVIGKVDIFVNEVDNQFRFRSLIAGDGLSITTIDNSTIRVSAIPLSLTNLTDIQFEETLENGQVLQYTENGTWANTKLDYNNIVNTPTIPGSLNDLNDVNITTPLAGQVLKFDANTNKWISSAISVNAEWGSITGSIYNQSDLVSELAAKQAKITTTNKLSYSLLKDTPTIPSLDGYATETWVTESFQAKITNDNKLSYSLLKDTPTIPSLTGYATETWVSTNFQTKLSSNNKLNPNYIDNLKTVATSGNYNDLTNKPTIPAQLTDLSDIVISSVVNNEILKYDATTNKWVNGVLSATTSWGNITGTLSNQTDLVSEFAAKQNVIDASHKLDYSLISNTPSIPSKTSDLNNDSGYITSSDIPALPANTDLSDYDNTTSKFVDETDLATKQDVIDANNKLDYSLIDNTPSIPTKTSDLNNDSGYITASSIPAVNDATLTIQKNGTTVDTFTANASTNKTINITETVQSANSPLNITNNALSISQAGNGTDGYLSGANWVTFNSKANAETRVIDNVTTTPSLDISLAEFYNQVYIYTQPLTSLTLLNSYPDSNTSQYRYETEIQFTTGSTFAFTAAGLANKWLGISAPTFEINSTYIIVIKNGYGVCSKVGE